MSLGMWRTAADADTADIHVEPINDLREHVADALTCWCRPARDIETPSVIVHNALDQRERYERGEIKLQ